MREILFRGKRKDTGAWVFGDLVHSQYKIGDTCVGQYGNTVGIHQVNPETVGQFTGRTDKNGNKVFEHDILQTFTVWADGTVEKCGVCIVRWRENDQCYVLTTKEGYHIEDFGDLGRPDYYKVIGNIHDNPELLEATQ